MNTAQNNTTVAFLRENGESKMYQEIIVRNRVDTMTKAFNYAVQKYGSKDCLGTRQILGKTKKLHEMKYIKTLLVNMSKI